jgi:hypothetical protein
MTDNAGNAADQIRFGFGNNWLQFIKTLDDREIAEAEMSLRKLLGRQNLNNMTFLDIGSGSGLFRLSRGSSVREFTRLTTMPIASPAQRLFASDIFPMTTAGR